MKVVFCSTTGKVRTFVKKLVALDESIETIEIKNGKEVVSDKFLLITPTTKIGEMPDRLVDFLRNDTNASNVTGVVGSGNRNWGNYFCGGAYKASAMVNAPVLYLFENRGNEIDVASVLKIFNSLQEKQGE